MIRLGTDLGIYRDLAQNHGPRTVSQLSKAKEASPELLGKSSMYAQPTVCD